MEKNKPSWSRMMLLNGFLVGTSLVIGLAVFEVGARLLLKPCAGCYGTLFGRRLPPFAVLAEGAVAPLDPQSIWKRGNAPNPENLTMGDLWGLKREDQDLGYTAVENAKSLNGWWQSNNIGARSKIPTAAQLQAGHSRVLIFGESYGQASRVAQEKTWFARLQAMEPRSEIVNFAVDGYSMGQSYLRFLKIREKIPSTTTVFMFVPESDLWRDVNTIRFLAEGWGAYTILPRFVLDGAGLKAIPGPYKIGSEIYLHDTPELTPPVRDHLLRYDAFYIRSLYESPPILGRLIAYKLVAGVMGFAKLNRLYADANTNNQSEALEIDRRIFKSVNLQTRESGQKFVLVLLPDPKLVAGIRKDNSGKNILDWGGKALQLWRERLALMEADGYPILDLMPTLTTVSSDELDFGYDGSHYGPKTNQVLSEVIHERLTKLDVF